MIAAAEGVGTGAGNGAGKGAGKEEATTMVSSDKSTERQRRGAAAETLALQRLQGAGLALVERNYRVARGPHARGGEIDLVLRDRDGPLVFVEVRWRADARGGGAAASVGARKRASLIVAARHYLSRWSTPPPCRFDVVAIDGESVEWLRAAFDAA